MVTAVGDGVGVVTLLGVEVGVAVLVAVGMVPALAEIASSAALTTQLGSAKRMEGCSRKKAIVLHSVPAGTNHRSICIDVPSLGELMVKVWTVSGWNPSCAESAEACTSWAFVDLPTSSSPATQ